MSTSGGYREDIVSTSGDVQYIGFSIEIERILSSAPPHVS